MKTTIDIAIPAITFLLLTVVGLDLTRADFVRLARQPLLIASGVIGPLVVLPPLALLVIALLKPPPDVQTGLLLMAICPVGGISNTYNYLARTSTALSVTLTGLSCLLATATIPLLSNVFEAALGRPLGVSAPAGLLFAQLLGMLAAPVALGMVTRSAAPAFARRHEARLRAAGFAALGLLIVFVIFQERDAFARELAPTAGVSAAFILASAGVGALLAWAAAGTRPDRFTLAVEFATRNVAIAAAVAITWAGHIHLAVFATTYFLTEVPIMLAAAAIYRWADASRGGAAGRN
jgi:bile acid:Na+ symporter, BASS family